MARPRESLESKFWKKIIKGDHENDCWKWSASKFKVGYGQITHGKFQYEHKNLKAHRVSYEIHFGAIPSDKIVCHTCDNRECTNPKHLFLGSWKDNAQDMIKKGRRYNTSGTNNGQAKITMEIAEKIRLAYAKNESNNPYVRKKFSQQKLAKKYGISQSVVHSIIKNEYWKK